MNDYLHFRDGFAAALDTELYTIEYLDWLIEEGRAQCWATERGAIIAEARTYPTGAKVIHGLSATGDLEEITGVLIPAAEAWARAAGCRFAIIESREGWVRQLRASGYEPFQVSLRKAL
jgi:hypothetical protein